MRTPTNQSRITRPWPLVGIGAQVTFTFYWLIAPLWQGPLGTPMVVVVTACRGGTLGWVFFGLLPRLHGTGSAQ